MSKQTVGTSGCIAVVFAILVALGTFFGGQVFQSAASSYYIWPCWLVALALFVLSCIVGIRSWPTLPGKVATIAGLGLGIPFAGFLFWARFIFNLKM